MKRITYYYHNRSQWRNPGVAEGEPDKVQWLDETTQLPCLIVRNHSGAWCGYVGVPPGHRYHGASYDDVPANCHGGLTFANHAYCNEDGTCIGQVSEGPDPTWWLGFDCSHCFDSCPAYDTMSGGIYRDMQYVIREVEELAKQLL